MFSTVESYYQFHARIYDLSRWAILFGRNRLMKQLPPLPNNSCILDFGCGTGAHLKWLLKLYPNARIIAVDQSEAMLQKARKNYTHNRIEFIQSDVFDLELQSKSFDLILASYSLTIIQKYDKVLPLLYELLDKNGVIAIVDFENTPFSWFKKWMKWNHVQLSTELFSQLCNLFPKNICITKRAFFGLWTYSIFTGYKSHKL